MKKIIFLFLTLFVFSNAYAENIPQENIESKIESILNNSNLTLSEKTEVQTLALAKLKKSQGGNSDTFKNNISKLSKYTAFTSSLAVNILELASEAGVSADAFIEKSWLGKITLISTFFYFGGNHLFNILFMITFAFLFSYAMRKVMFYMAYDNIKFKPEAYKTINVKRNWIGQMLCKTPTYQKRIPLTKYFSDNNKNNMGGLTVTYIFAVIVTPLAFVALSFILF